jgi:hypothetical protein
MSEKQIPDDVWTLVRAVLSSAGIPSTEADYGNGTVFEVEAEVIARAILAERERAIDACEAQKRAFLSAEYSANQPLGSLLERFACDECIDAIRNPSPAADPSRGDNISPSPLDAAGNDDFKRVQVIGKINE